MEKPDKSREVSLIWMLGMDHYGSIGGIPNFTGNSKRDRRSMNESTKPNPLHVPCDGYKYGHHDPILLL